MTEQVIKKTTLVNLQLNLLVLACLAAVLVGCGGPVLPETTPREMAPALTPAGTTPTVLTNGWYRYHDPELGFSFSYPAEARLKSGKSKFGTSITRLQFRLPGVPGYQGMVIRVESNPENLPIEAVVAEFYEQSTQEIVPEELLSRIELITVAGQPALKTDILATNADFSILFLHEGKVYLLAPVHDAVAAGVDPQALDLFYQILDTLAFDS